jgi:methanogenic corrinoid protein MtbC1
VKTEIEEAVQHFTRSFLAFEMDAMEGHARAMVDAGISVKRFLAACMPCMEEIGRKFEAGEYYLPELVVAGEMFKTVSRLIRQGVRAEVGDGGQGQIILGTPSGDIHDLGKDLFGVLAQASGFTVHNLGVDVPPSRFIEKLLETRAPVLGLSSLLTTTFEAIREIVALLKREGIRQHTFVILGGGATEKSLVNKLGVDAQTRDAYEGIQLVRANLQGRKKETAA